MLLCCFCCFCCLSHARLIADEPIQVSWALFLHLLLHILLTIFAAKLDSSARFSRRRDHLIPSLLPLPCSLPSLTPSSSVASPSIPLLLLLSYRSHCLVIKIRLLLSANFGLTHGRLLEIRDNRLRPALAGWLRSPSHLSQECVCNLSSLIHVRVASWPASGRSYNDFEA